MFSYHIIVIITVALAALTGWRRGLMRQANCVLAFAIAAVSSHLFSVPVQEMILSAIPPLKTSWAGSFISSTIAASIVYLAVYFIFSLVLKIFTIAMMLWNSGVIDSLFGAAFRIFNWLCFVSIFFNLLLCFNPESKLLKYATDDDGNIAGATLMISPFIIGCENADDLAHLHQLQEAKKISGIPHHNGYDALTLKNYNILSVVSTKEQDTLPFSEIIYFDQQMHPLTFYNKSHSLHKYILDYATS